MVEELFSTLFLSLLHVALTSHTFRCEYWQKGRRGHLKMSDIDDYDLDYLGALLDMDEVAIKRHEESALQFGYGPLAACSVSVPASAKRQHCSKHFGSHLVIYKLTVELS